MSLPRAALLRQLQNILIGTMRPRPGRGALTSIKLVVEPVMIGAPMQPPIFVLESRRGSTWSDQNRKFDLVDIEEIQPSFACGPLTTAHHPQAAQRDVGKPPS